MPNAPAGERDSDIRCDGCGQLAGADHIRRRILRLELATRFRPIHISVLFLIPAPPLPLEDYFYYSEDSAGVPVSGGSSVPGRSETARNFFDDLLAGCGVSRAAHQQNEAALGEFQHRGFFLAHCIECPLDGAVPAGPGDSRVQAAVDQVCPTLVKRIRYSYKPKHVVLLSAELHTLLPMLVAAGLQDQILVYGEGAVPLPGLEPAGRLEFRQALAHLVAQAAQIRTA